MPLSVRPLAIALLSAVMISAPASAQSSNSTGAQIHISQRNVSAGAENPGGVPRTEVRPGDVIRYTITLSNPGRKSVSVANITDAVPDGMRFVPGSTHSNRADARVEFSIDSGRTWGAEPIETVIANGRQVDRAVSPARYTHVRWVLAKPLAAKETVTAEFSARVIGR